MGSAADEAAARGEAARPAGDMAPPTAGELGAEQRRAADAGGRGTILLSGPAGTGKTEAAARRIAALGGTPVLALAANRASARRLRERVDQLRAEQPGEETWIGTWESIGERLLREQATAAGVDPFFDVLGPAERLAILLDRVEELPLRLHEIRGNPSSLLARLLRRIDSLKADTIGPEELAEQARAMRAGATDPATRESADREQEFAELYAAHDRILAEHGSLDRGDLTLACLRLARERPDLRAELAGRFPHLVVEEIEELDAAQWALLTELAAGCESLLATYDEDHDREGRDASARFTAICPGATRLTLEQTHRGGARVRFWRCANRRAQAQATAREIESLIAGGAEPESICVFVGRPARDGLAVGAALEERSIPFRLTDPAALFRRPEVRDTIAWLRLLADPGDSPAAARALTRPPVQLRSADLARLTTIARRRKLNLVAACAAALESPQFQPEARDRLREFLKLYEAASKAMEDRRADVFVRRLIERVGLRRQRMFAAQAEVAERLISLSRLAEVATAWSRREPQGTTRDFIRYVSAIADAGLEMGTTGEVPRPGTVAVIALDEARGLEFAHVFAIGLDAGGDAAGASGAAAGGGDSSPADRSLAAAMTRARESLVLAWPQGDDGQARPSPAYAGALALLEAEEEDHAEELFGPGEGMHATYRMLREDVLESSWLVGRQLNEPRLDTAIDLNRAITRYLELLKLAALAQRPEQQQVGEAIEAINGILRQVATPDQLSELGASSLDEYLLDSEREHSRRRGLVEARDEPSLEAFLPKRGEGLRLSATDLDLYLTCPLKYKFARVFALPREPTINQRFGILIHSVLDRFHRDHPREEVGEAASLARLSSLFEAGWRRSGFGDTDDELQFRDRARAAIRRYWEREREAEGEPVWLEKSFEFRVGPHHLRGRVDRVDRLPSGEHELIDYKTGARKSRAELVEDLQLSLYRLAAERAWGIEAGSGSYYYVLDAEKVRVEPQPDDSERVERTVHEVGAGVLSQDFEPHPSPAVCSWCDYRLVCPAAEK